MFDPENEPEDIFADVDTGAPPGVPAPEAPPQIVATSFGPSRTPIILGVIAVLAIIGGAGWYFLSGSGSSSVNDTGDVINDLLPQDEDTSPIPAPEPEPRSAPEIILIPEPAPESEPEPEPPPAPTIPIDVPDAVLNALDSDRDGLNDIRERDLGTNPQSADTDSDGLSDFDEVEKYGTDPTDPDTDGDGYLDGKEVEGGYNPNGPGTL